MELGLSLGDASPFLPETTSSNTPHKSKKSPAAGLDFCMDLSLASPADAIRIKPQKSPDYAHESDDDSDDEVSEEDLGSEGSEGAAAAARLQLNLLPLSPVPRRVSPNFLSLPWNSDNGVWEKSSPGKSGPASSRGLDVNGMPEEERYGNGGEKKRRYEGAMGNEGVEGEKTSSRASDEEENGGNSRKKLRLSKEQSAFLEESFKEHHTLNPKQKLGLAKQLNLRPRQVEVWFQNRRARTKLKQTEVDCEYLKRCCDTLAEENRRLHKELQELRALKASSSPFYPHRPATTLTMCPSCERVATATPPPPPSTTQQTKPMFYPFSTHPNQPAASSST